MKQIIQKVKTGFTLIELLIVIGILAILAAAVFFALNPVARFRDARNSRRQSDVSAILNAIKVNQVDKKNYLGAIENEMDAGSYYMIGTAGTDVGCTAPCANPTVTLQPRCINLDELVSGDYIPSIPFDPNQDSASKGFSYYYISKTEGGIITVGSCSEEQDSNGDMPEIQVKK